MRQYSDQAVRSFFGARPGGQERPQDINTPESIIDSILQVWPEGIALDPCSNVHSIVLAEHRVIGRYNVFLDEWITCHDPALDLPVNTPMGEGGGLTVYWPNYTYVNPPYRDLKKWIDRGVRGAEHLLLIPVRTLRTWWCETARRTAAIGLLKPVIFDGYDQSYPTPLAVLYFGSRIDLFCRAFAPLCADIIEYKSIMPEKTISQEILNYGGK